MGGKGQRMSGIISMRRTSTTGTNLTSDEFNGNSSSQNKLLMVHPHG
jgi:hypothetical protein